MITATAGKEPICFSNLVFKPFKLVQLTGIKYDWSWFLFFSQWIKIRGKKEQITFHGLFLWKIKL